MKKATKTKRTVGDRESFRGDEHQLLDGRRHVRTSGLRLGRSLASVPFNTEMTLTVTELVGCRQRMKKTTKTKRPVGDRESFRGDDLQLLDGTLYERATGLRLGRSLASVPFSTLVTLTVTSSKLERVGGDLVSVCSGPCGERFPLHHMGLLRAGDGQLRSQPQCPACRGRYGKHAHVNTIAHAKAA